MKLINHVLDIRHLIQLALANQFDRLGLHESGITEEGADTMDKMNTKSRLDTIISDHKKEMGDYAEARQYTINECVFTLFNRIAAVKVMEAKELFPTVITTSPEFGNHSFGHQAWLQENPNRRSLEREGLAEYLQEAFEELGKQMPLFHKDYPYQLFPTADELFQIIQAFNAVEQDPDCGVDVWKGDDILGWLYENFNAVEKEALKASGEKTEYNKVSLQSQVYTPQWVVKFLVDNTLGKQYLEMYPDSQLTSMLDDHGQPKYRIANAPNTQERKPKMMHKIRVIDPACGSGNFLIYSFSLLYDMYLNQIEQYGADYSRRDIPKLIVENNIFGVDLDERAVQLSQIALYIKARELGGRRAPQPSHTNVVSSHFFLPEYEQVSSAFDNNEWNERQKLVIQLLWNDLRDAYKFGSLIRIEKSFKALESADTKEATLNMFADDATFDMEKFKKDAIAKLRSQVKINVAKKYSGYTLTKTEDALRFLDILTTPFDVVVANPPYTDSADFGTELKTFVEANYKKPLAFNSNLYACFIKRCCELAGDKGKVGMIHPHTFMFIKTFEDVRKFMIEKTHINVMVDYGLDRVNLFGPDILLDATFYTLDMNKSDKEGVYFNITANQQEKFKKGSLHKAYADFCDGIVNDRVYTLPQSKLKLIKSYPFIYWISDEFRQKFNEKAIEDLFKPASGAATANNNRFLRFWWELDSESISYDVDDCRKWKMYAKGGPFKKWSGNLWLMVNWGNDGEEMKQAGAVLRNSDYYFKEGVTYSASGSKGASFRILPVNCAYDVGGASIFPKESKLSNKVLLGYLNTKLADYIVNCLNPTVNTQVGDISRIPFIEPTLEQKRLIEDLVNQCIEISHDIDSFCIIELDYKGSPIIPIEADIIDMISAYYCDENARETLVLCNDAIINNLYIDIFGLSKEDVRMVEDKEGKHIATLPVTSAAKSDFLLWLKAQEDIDIHDEVYQLIDSLEVVDKIDDVQDFEGLYQSNNDWEEFCIRHQLNPIEVWYQFRNASVLPPQRTQVLAFELLADVIRTILAKDDDGVIPLINSLGEARMGLRIEQELHDRGYTNAQTSQILQLLGMPLDRYLTERFFAQLSDHLNLFMYLPKTPFIWHITSGPKHALDLYVSIYKWSRDTLYRVKSVYAANREANLRDQIAQLRAGDEQARARANDVQEQLDELNRFTQKLDDLLASNYDPKLDDGVGKNIAPLQKRGLIAYDVLNTNQLKKYLNADW